MSHTWGAEEVTFQDMADLGSARMKGFAKIEHCCRQALRDGLHWALVDTCCVDKTSSAELSETINSMFKWYSRALKRYAFLEDGGCRHYQTAPDNVTRSRFFPSRWWTRGWTLQELIAPHDVEFYNRSVTASISSAASVARSVPESMLNQLNLLGSICAADKISWASAGKTTREEDMAYCLLGILDVNMRLLYGGGGESIPTPARACYHYHRELQSVSVGAGARALGVPGRLFLVCRCVRFLRSI
ncbi:hypothetical protein N657DRAFT_699006 [Parathielavia appendiculata]|uniref:Heterokaryon incompatibility domain-containing protein n=1 Tax=Parathielavia appendiculata TaxID=2587402 RepID=A0AAN6Z2E9_9PEZI|nr:hypothetical protein N657DRAFT_699006 [Parathielavia appendiculata]